MTHTIRRILPVGDPTRPTRIAVGQRWIGTRGTEYRVTAVNGDTATVKTTNTGSEYAAPARIILGRYRYVWGSGGET